VQTDTGLWLSWLGHLMQEDSFGVAAVLARWLLQFDAELTQHILLQTEPAAELMPQSAQNFAGFAKEKSKSLLLLPAAVGVLELGSSVQHVVAMLMLQYLLQLEFAAERLLSTGWLELVLQHCAGQHIEQQGNRVHAERTAVVHVQLCLRRAGPGQMVDSGDLQNWPEDTEERISS